MSVNSIGVLNMIDKLAGMHYLYVPEHEEIIKELLIGHSVKKVKDNILELDNGTQLEFYGNDGCCCGAGCYDITELNDCNNIITNVEFTDDVDNGRWESEHCYRIYVYAENKQIKLLQCDGDDGNGWYGTGYYIKVKFLED